MSTSADDFANQDRGNPRPLRILQLKDSPVDAELEQYSLTEGGINCELERVQTRADFAAALRKGGFDIVLADYALPGFDGLSALGMAQKAYAKVPFIFVSGTLGEEAAIETLKSGATDYVLKHRLGRLAPPVRRAIRRAEERSERQRAEAALRRSEQQLRALAEQFPAVIYTQHITEHSSSMANPALYASLQIKAQSGYPPQAFVETPGALDHNHVCWCETGKGPRVSGQASSSASPANIGRKRKSGEARNGLTP